ncbi:hypothetical protein DD237_008086 [Peronospora effusa]|uniref:Uncharacterized protein n=1 Tax=Peronospora effusa TaxID=542832 RepID=A0A3R7Z3J7_9STRA|nr:hypothetical protein DD237_008086 [Peronospora effusa]
MIYSFESLQHGWTDIDVEVCGRALTAYESAFQLFGKECKDEQDAGNAILNNWMLVLAHQDDDLGEEDKNLQVFVEKKALLNSAVSWCIANSCKANGADIDWTCQLMLKIKIVI